MISFCSHEEFSHKLGIKGTTCLPYLSRFARLVQKVVFQTKSRVFEGKPVKASEKIVSLFEDHGDIIMTGKKNDPQFGHKILLIENEYGLILDFEVLRGNPNDATPVPRVIEGYEKIQEKSPDLVALDRGFYSNQNKKILGEWGVKQVCLHGERV